MPLLLRTRASLRDLRHINAFIGRCHGEVDVEMWDELAFLCPFCGLDVGVVRYWSRDDMTCVRCHGSFSCRIEGGRILVTASHLRQLPLSASASASASADAAKLG